MRGMEPLGDAMSNFHFRQVYQSDIDTAVRIVRDNLTADNAKRALMLLEDFAGACLRELEHLQTKPTPPTNSER